ncbi:probable inactive tRNA-specific adenosine deaminase-like protein 3 isoform X1 [Artemia franciscana]|uniref:probable inactive tRNA-specific adenosine deaminase-like protein 3 isoform X1 n=1 Tax=Artemia franciscana TaxID=6661 RepID=UPI0032D9FA63
MSKDVLVDFDELEREATDQLQFQAFTMPTLTQSQPTPSFFQPDPKGLPVNGRDEGFQEQSEQERSKSLNHPEALLSVKYSSQIETIEAYSAVIKNKKMTSKLIKNLADLDLMPSFGHLKKVRAIDGVMECLLSSRNSFQSIDDLVLHFKNQKIDISMLVDPIDWKVVRVPRKQPVTRRQFEESKLFWPSAFHEDPVVESLLNKHFFSFCELEILAKLQELANLAGSTGLSWWKKEKALNINQITHVIDFLKNRKRSVLSAKGAVIYNHENGEILSFSCDQRHLHPIKHCAMVVIDSVAAIQGGGAWINQRANEIDALLVEEVPKEIGEVLVVEVPHKRRKKDDSSFDTTAPYLCTGYDVFMTHEPCVMCAMGLLHSRVKRLFFENTSENGALVTKVMLHTLNGINHRFGVFFGKIQSD